MTGWRKLSKEYLKCNSKKKKKWCSDCEKGKAKAQPFRKKNKERTKEIGSTIHADIKGPIEIPGLKTFRDNIH